MHELKRAWISKVLLGGDFPIFKPCGSDGPDSIGVRVCRILDAFSAQAVVYCWDHPRRDKDREEFHIPDQLLGTMIESCGDTLDESHMPLGWPMSIDGAVRQFCMHKRDTIQELNGMLAEFNLQRSSVEINRNTTL